MSLAWRYHERPNVFIVFAILFGKKFLLFLKFQILICAPAFWVKCSVVKCSFGAITNSPFSSRPSPLHNGIIFVGVKIFSSRLADCCCLEKEVSHGTRDWLILRLVATFASTMAASTRDVDNAASMPSLPEQCLFFCSLLGAAVEWRHCVIDLCSTTLIWLLFYIQLSKQGVL